MTFFIDLCTWYFFFIRVFPFHPPSFWLWLIMELFFFLTKTCFSIYITLSSVSFLYFHFSTTKNLVTDLCSSLEDSDLQPFWIASKEIFFYKNWIIFDISQFRVYIYGKKNSEKKIIFLLSKNSPYLRNDPCIFYRSLLSQKNSPLLIESPPHI